jgi:hypothetical protein
VVGAQSGLDGVSAVGPGVAPAGGRDSEAVEGVGAPVWGLGLAVACSSGDAEPVGVGATDVVAPHAARSIRTPPMPAIRRTIRLAPILSTVV